MKRGLFIIVFSLLTLLVQAQTFVCTDAQFYTYNGQSISASNVQKYRAKALGSKAFLKFYDNSLKVSDSQGESLVLDKSNGKDDEYYLKKRLLTGNVKKVVLKLNKTVGYIRSFTVVRYFDNKVEEKYTYKRD